MIPIDDLLGVVLCGGRSSRMGRDKAQLIHSSGISYVDHAVDRLRRVCNTVCLSVAADLASIVPAEGALNATCSTIPRIPDAVGYRGPAGGIAASLGLAEQTGCAGCLITPVDMPELTDADLEQLLDRWLLDPHSIVCALDPERDQPQPLVAVYPTQIRAAIEELALSEDRSLRRWLWQRSYQGVPLSSLSLLNINRPEEIPDAG